VRFAPRSRLDRSLHGQRPDGQPSHGSLNKAILLDRDGTLIVDSPYLGDPDKVVLEPAAAPALRELHRAGYLVIVITNQSGIGRGFFEEADFHAVQARLAELLLAEGVPVHAYYFCPHHPTEAVGEFLRSCACRKPAPGMIEAAIVDHDLDRTRSFMVGDKLEDVAAGQSAGMRSMLVRTGLGARHEQRIGTVRPDFVADDLAEAVASFISRP
jgi:D-glycero-D-manno-heptose 1,7-bisphosphate phosphatase